MSNLSRRSLVSSAAALPAAVVRRGARRFKQAGRDYINRMIARVRKRSEMPLQLTSWCLLLLVALGKAGQ